MRTEQNHLAPRGQLLNQVPQHERRAHVKTMARRAESTEPHCQAADMAPPKGSQMRRQNREDVRHVVEAAVCRRVRGKHRCDAAAACRYVACILCGCDGLGNNDLWSSSFGFRNFSTLLRTARSLCWLLRRRLNFRGNLYGCVRRRRRFGVGPLRLAETADTNDGNFGLLLLTFGRCRAHRDDVITPKLSCAGRRL